MSPPLNKRFTRNSLSLRGTRYTLTEPNSGPALIAGRANSWSCATAPLGRSPALSSSRLRASEKAVLSIRIGQRILAPENHYEVADSLGLKVHEGRPPSVRAVLAAEGRSTADLSGATIFPGSLKSEVVNPSPISNVPEYAFHSEQAVGPAIPQRKGTLPELQRPKPNQARLRADSVVSRNVLKRRQRRLLS